MVRDGKTAWSNSPSHRQFTCYNAILVVGMFCVEDKIVVMTSVVSGAALDDGRREESRLEEAPMR